MSSGGSMSGHMMSALDHGMPPGTAGGDGVAYTGTPDPDAAISLVTAPGAKLSATIAAFSVVLQRRRRGVPVSTSTRRNVCSLIGKLLGKVTSPHQPGEAASPD